MTSNSELRARARQILGGQIFATPWLMGLVACLVVGALVGVASSVGAGILIVYGPLMAGLAFVLLPLVRGTRDTVEIGDVFKGFTDNFTQKLLVGLMVQVFTFLWTLLFIVPGIVKGYSYSMAVYLSADHPDWDWNRCITESRTMMYGKKWKLFCLDFSFVGWYIVGALCLGVGVLWVDPYHEAARAAFYAELTGTVGGAGAANGTAENIAL